MALLPREGEPRLLISMSSRDVPAMKLMTWIPDVLSGWTWESAFDPWLAKLAGEGRSTSARVGFDLMRPPLFALAGEEPRQPLPPAGGRRRRSAAFARCGRASCRRSAPPRGVVQAAGGSLRASLARAARASRRPRSTAERTARLMAAQDVRTLVSFDGGRTLAPFRGAFEPQTTAGPLVGYIAVKHMGYWADAVRDRRAARSDVAAARAGGAATRCCELAGPGVSAAELHATATRGAWRRYALHPVLSGSVGRRIGLSLERRRRDHAATAATCSSRARSIRLHVGALRSAGRRRARVGHDRDHGDRSGAAARVAASSCMRIGVESVVHERAARSGRLRRAALRSRRCRRPSARSSAGTSPTRCVRRGRRQPHQRRPRAARAAAARARSPTRSACRPP